MQRLMFLGVLTVFFVAFSVPVMAADWNLYGSARMSTFYWDKNKNAGDDQATDWDLQGNARIGAMVNVSEAIDGRFEFAVTDETSAAKSVSTRLLYATYKFDGGTLLLGQSYTPLADMFYSNQVYGWIAGDTDLLGVGQIWDWRRPMIMLSMKGLQVALVEPTGVTDLGTGGDEDIIVPKLEVKYHYVKDNLFADIFGGYQTYRICDIPNESSQPVSAYTVGLGGGATFGKAYLKGGAYIAKNAGQFDLLHIVADDATFGSSKLTDNNLFGGLVVAGFKATDKVDLQAGYGFVVSRMEESTSDKDTASSYYAQASIAVVPGFFIVPEIGVIDYGRSAAVDVPQGKNVYGGAKWQINF
ncbi:MAG: hypothetical protein JXM72_04810 [Deltaproteobacteria bacterium]|nr:hypothetical protein [Deltaproteobacteria bacterium]